MPISSEQLSNMINTLSQKYNFDEKDALQHLATKNMLPKNMASKLSAEPETKKKETIFASKKAEELAKSQGIKPKGQGTGKLGKWTLKDIQLEITKKQAIEEHKQSASEESESEEEQESED